MVVQASQAVSSHCCCHRRFDMSSGLGVDREGGVGGVGVWLLWLWFWSSVFVMFVEVAELNVVAKIKNNVYKKEIQGLTVDRCFHCCGRVAIVKSCGCVWQLWLSKRKSTIIM